MFSLGFNKYSPGAILLVLEGLLYDPGTKL